MKKEKLMKAIGEVDENLLQRSECDEKKSERRHGKRDLVIKIGAAAACLTLILAVGVPLLTSQGEKMELSEASKGVKVNYTDSAPEISSSSDLVWLSEEELFHNPDREQAAVKGTVTDIRNIEIDFNGDKEYRAIAKIEVEKVYRGDCKEKDTISILLPCPINTDVWVEDCDTVSAMRVGMTGIFMPVIYDEEKSFREQNGARLMMKDIADYGLADGWRYVFLETEDGLIFAREAYESIRDAATLDEVEEYVIKMISKE